jgi:F0F1-type ATP synthase membrane subunit c/vacuolar-type H+-ATPase subunit K
MAHYATIASIVAALTLGAGIGGAQVSNATLKALDIQPAAQGDILKASLIGLALIETGAILGFIITIMLLGSFAIPQASIWAEFGLIGAIGIPGLMVGIISATPIAQACLSIARQPFFSAKILNLMLVTQTMIQTPLLFGFLIALFIVSKLSSLSGSSESFSFFSAGLALGLGSIGPSIGLSHFAGTACMSVGMNPKAYGTLIPFTLMSQAIIETPLIFAGLIALIMIGSQPSASPIYEIKLLAAALCIGIGTLVPSISSSKTASAACENIAKNPSLYSQLSQVSMFGQGLIDAAAVYALLISIILVLVK